MRLRLVLIPVGAFNFPISARGGFRHFQNAVISKDTTIQVGN